MLACTAIKGSAPPAVLQQQLGMAAPVKLWTPKSRSALVAACAACIIRGTLKMHPLASAPMADCLEQLTAVPIRTWSVQQAGASSRHEVHAIYVAARRPRKTPCSVGLCSDTYLLPESAPATGQCEFADLPVRCVHTTTALLRVRSGNTETTTAADHRGMFVRTSYYSCSRNPLVLVKLQLSTLAAFEL